MSRDKEIKKGTIRECYEFIGDNGFLILIKMNTEYKVNPWTRCSPICIPLLHDNTYVV